MKYFRQLSHSSDEIIRFKVGSLLSLGLFAAIFTVSLHASVAVGSLPGLSGVLDKNAVVEKMIDGFSYANGPAASRLGFILFTDAGHDKIWKYIPKGTNDVFEGGASASESGIVLWRESSGGATGLTLDRQGRVLVCETQARRVTRTEKDGTITVLADRFDGKRLNHPADLVHAIDGSTYFTDPRVGELPDGESFEQPSMVFQIRRNGELNPVATDFEQPTGLAFSPNQRIIYIADAARNHIRAFDIEGDGALVNSRVFATLQSGQDIGVGGIKIDLAGNVFCAGPGGIWIFDKTGAHLGFIAVPEVPSNIGWGDNFKSLYITAQTSLYRIRLKSVGTRTY